MESERSCLKKQIAAMVPLHAHVAVIALKNVPRESECTQHFDGQDLLFLYRENSKVKPIVEPAENSLSCLQNQLNALALTKRIINARPDSDFNTLRALSRAQSSIRLEISTKA